MENDIVIYICTHTDFKPYVHDKHYQILDRREVDPEGLRLDDDFYSEIYMYKWVRDHMPNTKYIGFCHYRKYFAFMDHLPDFDEIFKEHDICLPEPMIFKETIRGQYAKGHNIEDLEIVESIIRTEFPDYVDAFEETMNSTNFYACNMFIMKTEEFPDYFDFVLGVLDKYIDTVGTDYIGRIESNKDKYLKDFPPCNIIKYQHRIGGYLAERLTNTYIRKHYKNPLELMWCTTEIKGCYLYNNTIWTY